MNTFDRVMGRVDTSAGPDACHAWTGASDQEGRGRVGIDGRQWVVPRWLLGHARGQHLKSGELACHHCDNPSCCNLKHLYVGDASSNMRDMYSRGRHPSVARPSRRQGRRDCRACIRDRVARYKARRAEAS